jgi:thiol-disulfide isomerase/thioredoxin
MAGVEIEALDGSKTKVSDHKGKVLMLNLWGIWCGPCRDEMPHLNQMQKQYADKGLEVISLNIGDHDGRPEPVENIKKFAEQMKLDYTLARIQGENISQFYMLTKQQVVPQTILIDRNSHLRGVFIGGGQNVFNSMQQAIDKTMAE